MVNVVNVRKTAWKYLIRQHKYLNPINRNDMKLQLRNIGEKKIYNSGGEIFIKEIGTCFIQERTEKLKLKIQKLVILTKTKKLHLQLNSFQDAITYRKIHDMYTIVLHIPSY